MKLTPRVWARFAATVIAPFSRFAIKQQLAPNFNCLTVALRSRSHRQVSTRAQGSEVIVIVEQLPGEKGRSCVRNAKKHHKTVV